MYNYLFEDIRERCAAYIRRGSGHGVPFVKPGSASGTVFERIMLSVICCCCWIVCLTLSLPIFWQFCSLSATFILTGKGHNIESQAYKFSKIIIFLPFLSMTFKKYPKFEISKSIILWTQNNVCKQGDVNKYRRGGPSRRSATLAVCYDVADRRRWQWKS